MHITWIRSEQSYTDHSVEDSSIFCKRVAYVLSEDFIEMPENILDFSGDFPRWQSDAHSSKRLVYFECFKTEQSTLS